MPTPREHILTALADLLRTVPHVPVLRGEVLPERISPAGMMILRDGDPGDPAVTLSPLIYHFQHRTELEVIVQGEARSAQQMQGSGGPLQGTNDRDTAFAALCAQIGAVIRADRTLGGRCDWVEAEAPQPVDLPVEGAASLKAAVIPVVLHYSTSDPLG